ncbi:hypothetical protein CAPTEDRAFT_196934 [Capitella teleta]|uniref:G-protein coupled receptors family 1 profile domain-containing protein n=1 Tax=Capitella teleta TaxID=283909 RepID=R7V1C5_CAPTE|nr:hypothetical protein CAPTEDRAFT_196934 [Capitella teleta]|eukprot:ELU12349.1 hypothetical protein CAPTEDRAFT_196934 [Capitella teleta]
MAYFNAYAIKRPMSGGAVKLHFETLTLGEWPEDQDATVTWTYVGDIATTDDWFEAFKNHLIQNPIPYLKKHNYRLFADYRCINRFVEQFLSQRINIYEILCICHLECTPLRDLTAEEFAMKLQSTRELRRHWYSKYIAISWHWILLYAIIMFTGLTGNILLVVAILGFMGKKKSVTHTLMFSIAISDLMTCLICVPIKEEGERLQAIRLAERILREYRSKQKETYRENEPSRAKRLPPGTFVSVRILNPKKGETRWQPGYQVISSHDGALRVIELDTGNVVRINQRNVREIPESKPYDEINPIPPLKNQTTFDYVSSEAKPIPVVEESYLPTRIPRGPKRPSNDQPNLTTPSVPVPAVSAALAPSIVFPPDDWSSWCDFVFHFTH